MLNTRGSAAFWLIFTIVVLLVVLTVGWWSLNDGWRGNLPDTWQRLKAVIPGGAPAEEPLPSPQELAERPAFPGPGVEEPFGPPPPVEAPPAVQPGVTPPPAAADSRAAGPVGSPQAVLRACVERLQADDLIGAEQYVSEPGLRFVYRGTTGIHEVIWKGLFKVHAFDEIGYGAMKVSGQTAWFPLYTTLGNTRMTTMLVMANRGDGWKLDRITDPARF